MAARDLIQEVLSELEAASLEFRQDSGQKVEFSPGGAATQAKYDGDFRPRFHQETGLEFTPGNFDQWRHAALLQADLFVAVRTAMSESTALEIGRFTELHKDGWERCFILAADTREAVIKTTLLKSAVVIPFATVSAGPEAYRLADPLALRESIKSGIFGSSYVRKTLLKD